MDRSEYDRQTNMYSGAVALLVGLLLVGVALAGWFFGVKPEREACEAAGGQLYRGICLAPGTVIQP